MRFRRVFFLIFAVILSSAWGYMGFLYGSRSCLPATDREPYSQGASPLANTSLETAKKNSPVVFGAFTSAFASSLGSAGEKLAGAPLRSEISLTLGERAYPASAWALASLIEGVELTGDMESEIPLTRIETAKLDLPSESAFSVRWGDREHVLKIAPELLKTLTLYQEDGGPIPLSATLIWEGGAKGLSLPEWSKELESLGFKPLVTRGGGSIESSGEGLAGSEHFFFALPSVGSGNGKALLKTWGDEVVYADVTLSGDALAVVQQTLGSTGIPRAGAVLPESLTTGVWSWRERGGLRSSYVKAALNDGAGSLYSLYRWSEVPELNNRLVYGLARTWDGYLTDLSLWFDREGWEEVRDEIFRWFGVEGFGFTDTSAPILKDGLELSLNNVDGKIVVAGIRDALLQEFAGVRRVGNGEGIVKSVRAEFLKKELPADKEN